MAGSFKTPCPSCEADVLVKGANLVGKKIDCPKCKYRFTVPNPDGEDAGDGFEVVEKPKKKGNPKALVGIALGVVAVAALGIGAVMMFGGEKEEPKPVVQRPVKPTFPGDPPSDVKPKDPPKDKDKTKDPSKTTPIGTGEIADPNQVKPIPKDNLPKASAEILAPPAKMKDATNLLPGQSVGIISLNMDRLRTTPIYGSFFDKSMLDFFYASMTFEVSDVESVHLCLVDADRLPFAVIRTKKPVSLVGMTQKMDIKNAPLSPINKRDFFEIKTNPFITAISRALSVESLYNDAGVPVTEDEKKRWEEKPMGIHRYDSQTIVLGEMNTLARWLGELDANGDLPALNVVAPPPGGAAPPAGGAPAPAPVPEKGGGIRGGGEATPTPPADPNAPVDPNAPPVFAAKADYLSITPELKQMLNRLAADEKNPPVAMLVNVIDHRTFEREFGGPYDQAWIILKVVLPTVKSVGASLNVLNKDVLDTSLIFSYINDADAKESIENRILPILKNYLEVPLVRLFNTELEWKSVLQANNNGNGGILPPRGNQAPAADDGEKSKSVVEILHNDKFAVIDGKFKMTSDRYSKVFLPGINDAATQLRGRMKVLSGEQNWYLLSSRFPALQAAKKPFPQGTLNRVSNPERYGLPWPPDERPSFIVDLLPYLGQGPVYGDLKTGDRITKTAWYKKENLRAAGTWIPQLLVPYYPQTSWRAYHPAADGGQATLGATNFVATAGIGRDAARLNPANPEHAKLVGITGYNWGSTPAEVKDGLSNTIYMLQVPPGHNRPWIAGGGATVMGVDGNEPLRDFISSDPKGTRGTYALMADGSVRFIPEAINKDLFKAMVTRAGEESSKDLDKAAAKVEPPKGLEGELKGGTAAAKKNDKSRIDEPELLKMQGKWKVTYSFRDGKAKTASEIEADDLKVTIDDTTLTFLPKEGAAQKKTIIKLDSASNPKRIFFENADGSPDPVIYVLEGDKLKILGWIRPPSADEYPKEMKPPSSGTPEYKYYEFTRVKD